MIQEELIGKIPTVLGLVSPDSLGLTLTHEHLLVNHVQVYFTKPEETSDRRMAHMPITMDNLHWVKLHPTSCVDNLSLSDEEVAIKEAMMFKQSGGGTIVDVTNVGICRDPLGLARIARATGLNIVMGAGYYIGASHSSESLTRSEQEIAKVIVRDILEGVGDTGVHAGIIGEIGCSLPLEETERRALCAAAITQQKTGVAINVHPSSSADGVIENIKILDDAGADLNRVAVSHCDSFAFSPDTCRKIMEAGCYVEFDTFGTSAIFPPYQGKYLDIPSDMKRVNDLVQFIADGYINRLLVAQDNFFKHQLTTWGGFGYAHILRNIVPVMRSKGLSREQINTLLVENPKRLLTVTPVKKRGNQ
jgi:phosphotriesterase-related protein